MKILTITIECSDERAATAFRELTTDLMPGALISADESTLSINLRDCNE